MAVARDLETGHNVIGGDWRWAMSAGMAYEAMNNAGAMDSRLIVILNDKMSIAPPVGAMSAYLSRLLSGPPTLAARYRQAVGTGPAEILQNKDCASKNMRALSDRRHAVEELGFYISGPSTAITWTILLPVCACARRRAWADSGPCRHPEGQGYMVRPRTPPTSITAWSKNSTSLPAPGPKSKGQRTPIHQGLCR